jgi:DNA processing protein
MQQNYSEEKLSALRLIRSETIGTRSFLSLLKTFGSAARAAARVNKTIVSADVIAKEIEDTHRYGAQIIYFKEAIYPPLLREIADPPPVITVLGTNMDLLTKHKVGIVGSRNASLNGVNFASQTARQVAELGYVTVSGLARGIDTAVHRASVQQGTIAVIAGGINNIYPPENKGLYDEIARTGLVISEAPFNAPPKAQSFPQRNRIISGLALGLIVVEASLKSGSLITANFALEQNREVFAVPGFPLDTRYSGTNKLIKQGAYLFETIDDLRNVLQADYKTIPALEEVETRVEAVSDHDIDAIHRAILSHLSVAPTNIDDLIRVSQMPAHLAIAAVTELVLLNKAIRVNNTIAINA